MALSWNDLFLSGSVVDLNHAQWGARLRLKASDLGIEDSDAVAKALSLGAHRLAPSEAFDAIHEIAGRAKRAVEGASLSFGFIRGARYVPDKNLPALLDKLRAIRAEYDAAVEAFVANYAATQAAQLPLIEQALAAAARTPEAAQAALSRVRVEYPTAGEVREKFKLSWAVYAVQGARTAGVTGAVEDETSEVKGVVREMVSGLRAEVTEKLVGVLALIQKGGILKSKSLEAALAVVDHVESVNVLGDEGLARQCQALRSALRAIEPGKRIADAEVAGLDTIKAVLETSLDEAVKAAEARLTGVGRRKLEVA